MAALLLGCAGPPGADPPAREPVAARSSATELYEQHCAVCHGRDGAGDGPASSFLFPAARDFTRARFRLVSTDNGVPTRADLVRTMRRGVPGSAMPAWDWLGDEELEGLAAHVRELAVQGVAARLEEDGVPPSAASLDARRALTPGDVLGPLPRGTKETRAVGRELFLDLCARCHAEDATGEPAPRFDEDGSLNWARDLTAGFFKGSCTPRDLSLRIRAGIPGTAMPAFDLGPEEVASLVSYVRTLVPAGSEDRLVHRRGVVRVRRVDALDGEGVWKEAAETDVVLAPLWWDEDAVLGVQVSGAHDGERLALRVRWKDSTGDTRLFGDALHTDAAAVQFSAAERPALFGMGTHERPTAMWHWQAVEFEEVAGALDLVQASPHLSGESFDGVARAEAPLYRAGGGAELSSDEADALRATGLGQVREVGPNAIDVRAAWRDGWWSVVFLRRLEPDEPYGVHLEPGTRVRAAFAVWNGAVGDHGARKSISIWQDLEVAR